MIALIKQIDMNGKEIEFAITGKTVADIDNTILKLEMLELKRDYPVRYEVVKYNIEEEKEK